MHGGAQDEELAARGLTAAEVLDLSANLHPDGPDAAVLAAAHGARLDRYPPPDAGPLRDAIAAAHGLDPATVLPVAGGTAGLHLVARALLGAGSRATVIVPTFGEYAAAARHAGATVTEVRAHAPAFEVDCGALPRADLTFLCVPDNPTGRDLAREEVVRAAEASGGLVVLDAAYETFADRAPFASDLACGDARIVAVHSMTKLHAVPGLRLGYVVGTPPLIARLGVLQHSWAIDAPSMAAGVVAAGQEEARRARLVEMRRTRDVLRATWSAAGLEVGQGAANFLLVHVGEAARVRDALLARRIVVRDASSFGLPEWVRVAVPPPARRDEVAAALIEAAGRRST